MFTRVEPVGDQFRVVINHPQYGASADIGITQYSNEEAAVEGAAWWEERLTNTPPDELHDLESDEVFQREDA